MQRRSFLVSSNSSFSNGKAVDKELVDNYIKNLMYFKDEQLNLELTTGNRRGRP